MKRLRLALPILLLAIGTATSADAAGSSFRYERTIVPATSGPQLIHPDAALLAGARTVRYAGDQAGGVIAGGLEDLRLFDAEEREIEYLLLAPRQGREQWKRGRIRAIAATKQTSGFEVDFGRRLQVDQLKLEGFAPPFMKRARLEGSSDATRWVLLADATLFDLPDEALRRTKIDFDEGEYRYLRLMWDDRSSARVGLPSRANGRVVRSEAAPSVRAGVEVIRRASEPGKSRYRLRLPGRELPVMAVEVKVARGNVHRPAEIHEARLQDGVALPVVLGSGVLRRVEREEGVAEEMAIAITRPASPDLELVIDDGDRAPLEIESVLVHFAPLPAIYFEASDARPIVARYGTPGASAPRYDLEAKRREIEPAELPEASWGEVQRQETTAEAPDVPLPPYGPALDIARFLYRREVPGGRRVLNSLLADAAVLAHSRDLADVRIVAPDGRQVPYVIEERDEPLVVELPLSPREAGGHRNISRYRLALPHDTFPGVVRLVLRTSARVFARHVTVERPPDEARGAGIETLAAGNWASNAPDLEAPPLVFDIRVERAPHLILTIDEGDNEPLPLATPELHLPTRRLRYFDPGDAPLTLAYGDAELERPRYDLALLGPQLFALPATEIEAEPEKEVPLPGAGKALVFAAALAGAVVILLLLLARLIRPEKQ